MANANGPGRRELPRWMRLLAEKWRVADQAAAYPHAVPPRPESPDPEPAHDTKAPLRDALASSSGEN